MASLLEELVSSGAVFFEDGIATCYSKVWTILWYTNYYINEEVGWCAMEKSGMVTGQVCYG